MSYMAPQAYTKETLVKAFDWLQHQPANVKQVATSPDVLVGLYLKAQRQGINNIDADAPVSSKKFIDDLKSLKKDFAQFEDPSASSNTSPTSESAPTIAPQGASMAPPPPPQPQQAPMMYSQPIKAPVYPTYNSMALDETSLSMLNNVQQRFNLSSPQEALRMVISVGFQHISRWQ